MPFVLKLCLNDNKSYKKIVNIDETTSYEVMLKIASDKFKKKILTVFNDKNEIH